MALSPEPASPRETILEVEDLSKNFGGLQAVSGLGFSLAKGELKGLIGPNGAGKSTAFNLISGLYRPSRGRVTLEGLDITGLKPDRIVRLGLARTFQTVKLLAGRTVLETMLTALFIESGYTALDAVLGTRRYYRREKELRDRAVNYLELLGVADLRDRLGTELAYGLQRKVSIAMALCLSPRILLLDEPMAGLTHGEKDDLMNIIRRLRQDFDLSLILVEHDMKVIMNLCESILVMNQGLLIAQGTAEEIRRNPQVIEAYIGTGRS